MARLRKFDITDIPATEDSQAQRTSTQEPCAASKPPLRSSPRKKAAKPYSDSAELESKQPDSVFRLQPKSTPSSKAPGKQRRLAPLQTASLSKPLANQPLLLPKTDLEPRKCDKSLFSKKLPSPAKKVTEAPSLSDSEPEEEVEVEVEESIWCGSDASEDSEDELPSPRKFLHFDKSSKTGRPTEKPAACDGELDLSWRLQGINLEGGRKVSEPYQRPLNDFDDVVKDSSRPTTSSDKENNDAILRFSPPRLHSPPKCSPARPVTPPQSPTKGRLQSPSKTKARVPSPKIRQSLDAFWNAETVNHWNDQYSPRKVLKSPKKPISNRQQGEDASPTTSPHKPGTSPSKRTKAERTAKAAFEAQKHSLAATFLTELDTTITSNQITTLAASTGGVKLIWSKTLNSTAGRANWRRETTKIRSLDGTVETQHKHHASIELAEKVIDNDHRLLNVLAHEFCHLANFMISGIKDRPHGAEFKAWGKKVSRAFAGSGVEVTTKHAYEIEFKYVWRCSNEEECGSEFKRHSRSIDVERQRCGQCRGRLVQVKPVPRGQAKGGDAGTKAAGGYAAYVKEHYAAVKKELPSGSTQKAVMEALGKKYRAEKETKEKAPASVLSKSDDTVDKLAAGVEIIELEDD